MCELAVFSPVFWGLEFDEGIGWNLEFGIRVRVRVQEMKARIAELEKMLRNKDG